MSPRLVKTPVTGAAVVLGGLAFVFPQYSLALTGLATLLLGKEHLAQSVPK